MATQRNLKGQFVQATMLPSPVTTEDLITLGRKVEYHNQKAALEEKGETEFFGGLYSSHNWDKGRFHVGFEDASATRKRMLPQNLKEEWGFDADDVKNRLEQGEFHPYLFPLCLVLLCGLFPWLSSGLTSNFVTRKLWC